jgi:hypothetical protein
VAGGEAAHPMDTERLNAYWAEGTGAAKIQWGVPGDFDRCRVEMAKVNVPAKMIPGHCANLHKRATAAWPGHAATEQRPKGS